MRYDLSLIAPDFIQWLIQPVVTKHLLNGVYYSRRLEYIDASGNELPAFILVRGYGIGIRDIKVML